MNIGSSVRVRRLRGGPVAPVGPSIVLGMAMLAGLAGLAGHTPRAHAQPVGNEFVYQGQLKSDGAAATGQYDLIFRLFDASAGGSQLGADQCFNDLQVTDGLFTVSLDFGGQYNGSQRFLEVWVRQDTASACPAPGTQPGFQLLSGRTQLRAAPYANYALSAGLATSSTNALNLGGNPPSFYTNAANLTGTLAKAQLPSSAARTDTVQTWTARPAFNGGTSGANSPFTVDSTFLIANLNADLLDGLDSAAFGRLASAQTWTGDNTFAGGSNIYFGNGENLAGLWRIGGNAGTIAGTNFLGTTDNVALEIRSNNVPAIRITPIGTDTHNIIGGSQANSFNVGVQGAFIGGGGSTVPMDEKNQVTGNFGAIGGGLGNTAANSAFVGGGFLNRAGSNGAVGGGSENWALGTSFNAVAGGHFNNIQVGAFGSTVASFVGGGEDNDITGATHSSILGGSDNKIPSPSLPNENVFGASILGGFANTATGDYATVAGGNSNDAGGDYSFVAGRRATTRRPDQVGDSDGDEGSFVWADAQNADFTSTGPNQFLVRASGGFGINTNSPQIGAARLVYSQFTNPGQYGGIQNNATDVGGWPFYGFATAGTFRAWMYYDGGAGTVNINNGAFNRLTIANTGAVNVPGTLTKGGGSFKIDHPLDPANKFLSHSFVESPDMMNIYNGNATTDGAGYATITLPEWFETLNRDFRYQLTIIDESDEADVFVWAKVVRKVKDNQFTIRTSKGGVEVSWQVTGIRQDRWAEANRIPVEHDKLGDEKGKYLHPELYGQPRSANIYDAKPERMMPGAAKE